MSSHGRVIDSAMKISGLPKEKIDLAVLAYVKSIILHSVFTGAVNTPLGRILVTTKGELQIVQTSSLVKHLLQTDCTEETVLEYLIDIMLNH